MLGLVQTIFGVYVGLILKSMFDIKTKAKPKPKAAKTA
jgi:hypothetical protein